ncbi:hypothetical protein T03_3006 [Trichinella britovi]|uniref:Uncharacterized protein n=1 Tax=Trichinella britovi TaxID=45882 RepID=A0A0V1D7Y9_TRIBR|nr:hypothetical protein T03_3006 [Trichinella britovi]
MVDANKEKSGKENCLLWISGIPVYVSKLLGQSEAASLSEKYTAKRTGRHLGFNFCEAKTELSLNQVSCQKIQASSQESRSVIQEQQQ